MTIDRGLTKTNAGLVSVVRPGLRSGTGLSASGTARTNCKLAALYLSRFPNKKSKIKSQKSNTVRLAPTPSGYLHRGNAANFLLNARLAGPEGRVWLRIDDLDRGRFRPEYLEDIFRVIERLGITVTDGPSSPRDFSDNWSQEYRMKDYHAALGQLRTSGLLFACPCSRTELANGHQYGCLQGKVSLDAENVAWRINTRDLYPVRVPDLVRAEPFAVRLHDVMPDFVVRKKDGRPSYQPACVVDDNLFGITTVGRGQDLLPSTAAQALLSRLMGFGELFARIDFLHHPLLTEADGRKLSKSAGAEGVSGLGDGFQPAKLEALVTGWLAGG